jgi:hypothetical protein
MHMHPVIRRHVTLAVEKVLLNNRNIAELINQTLIGAASHTIVNSSYTSPAVVLIRYPCQCTIRANKCSMVHENRTNYKKATTPGRETTIFLFSRGYRWALRPNLIRMSTQGPFPRNVAARA